METSGFFVTVQAEKSCSCINWTHKNKQDKNEITTNKKYKNHRVWSEPRVPRLIDV